MMKTKKQKNISSPIILLLSVYIAFLLPTIPFPVFSAEGTNQDNMPSFDLSDEETIENTNQKCDQTNHAWDDLLQRVDDLRDEINLAASTISASPYDMLSIHQKLQELYTETSTSIGCDNASAGSTSTTVCYREWDKDESLERKLTNLQSIIEFYQQQYISVPNLTDAKTQQAWEMAADEIRIVKESFLAELDTAMQSMQVDKKQALIALGCSSDTQAADCDSSVLPWNALSRNVDLLYYEVTLTTGTIPSSPYDMLNIRSGLESLYNRTSTTLCSSPPSQNSASLCSPGWDDDLALKDAIAGLLPTIKSYLIQYESDPDLTDKKTFDAMQTAMTDIRDTKEAFLASLDIAQQQIELEKQQALVELDCGTNTLPNTTLTLEQVQGYCYILGLLIDGIISVLMGI
jgi:hypothetical protein